MPLCCRCCHEAGHAVAHVVHGYKLLKVGKHDNDFSTTYIPRGFDCPCGGSVKNKGEDVDLRVGSCPQCEDYMVEFLAGKMAGNFATQLLVPSEHIDANSGHDESEVSDIVNECHISDEQKESLRKKAETEANTIVSTHQKVVATFADALHNANECLDGAEAEQIITALIKETESGEK